jgi:tetratricopeptide (TPR) repeat protein
VELSAVKASIDRALALAPELPDAHLALAYYHYWGFREYDAAAAEFERTLQLSPNQVKAILGLASIARRTGRIPEALSLFERALGLSPREALLLSETGWTHVLLRRYADADRQLRQALAIAPADANAMDALVTTRLFGFGDVAGARELMRTPPEWRIAGANGNAGDLLNLVNPRVYADFLDRRFADALQAWTGAPGTTEEERRSARVARAVIRYFAGEGKAAQDDCGQLAALLRAELAKAPDSLGLLQQLSWVEVCLGRHEQALAASRTAADLLPIGKDSYFGTYQMVGLAQIAAHAGAPEQALDLIRQLLAMPAGAVVSVARLKLDPVWDPLRKDPRFQVLVVDAEAAQAKGHAP